MRPKRFVETVKRLEFPKVLDEGDYRRVVDFYNEANEHSEKHLLVGFRVPGPVVRIVWVAIEVIGDAADKDLPPDIPPSEDGYLALRFDGLWFGEWPTAELAELNEATPAELAQLDGAKPDDLKDSPAILFAYPGRVSWEKLLQAADQLL